MPFDLLLPAALKKARWKVKIREKETREPPHVTILRKTKAWRINLRTRQFMDDQPDPDQVPAALLQHIHAADNWTRLCDEWDRKYSDNPVQQPADGE